MMTLLVKAWAAFLWLFSFDMVRDYVLIAAENMVHKSKNTWDDFGVELLKSANALFSGKSSPEAEIKRLFDLVSQRESNEWTPDINELIEVSEAKQADDVTTESIQTINAYLKDGSLAGRLNAQ